MHQACDPPFMHRSYALTHNIHVTPRDLVDEDLELDDGVWVKVKEFDVKSSQVKLMSRPKQAWDVWRLPTRRKNCKFEHL